MSIFLFFRVTIKPTASDTPNVTSRLTEYVSMPRHSFSSYSSASVTSNACSTPMPAGNPRITPNKVSQMFWLISSLPMCLITEAKNLERGKLTAALYIAHHTEIIQHHDSQNNRRGHKHQYHDIHNIHKAVVGVP